MAQSFSGTIPVDAPAGGYSTLFESLTGLAWRDIPVPYSNLTTELRQDLAIHKFVDRDGAHIEGTGRAPLQITAHIPFLISIAPAANEYWGKDPLYPVAWRKFFEACADKSTGVLLHPELGPLTCKCEVFGTTWDANTRAGVMGQVTWIETDDVTDDVTAALSRESPLANLSAAAGTLDTNLGNIAPSTLDPNKRPTFSSSFTDIVNQIKSVTDQTTLLQKQFAGQLDNLVWNANRLEDSLAAAGQAVNWPLVQAAEELKAAAYASKQVLLSQNKPVAFYTVLKDSTLAAVANAIPAPISDVVQLNRQLMSAPLIVQGTVVRYYPQAA